MFHRLVFRQLRTMDLRVTVQDAAVAPIVVGQRARNSMEGYFGTCCGEPAEPACESHKHTRPAFRHNVIRFIQTDQHNQGGSPAILTLEEMSTQIH